MLETPAYTGRDYYTFHSTIAEKLGIEAAIVYEEITNVIRESAPSENLPDINYQEIETRLSFMTGEQVKHGLAKLIKSKSVVMSPTGKIIYFS